MIKFEDIKKEFSFIYTDKQKDLYFCNCGKSFEKKNEANDNENTLKKEDISYLYDFGSDESCDMGEIYKSIKLGVGDEVFCPQCNKNFSTLKSQKTLIPVNNYFLSDFEFIKNDDFIKIVFNKYKTIMDNGEIVFDKKRKFIKFYIKTKEIVFQNYEKNDYKIGLETSNMYSKEMFSKEDISIYNIMDLHLFLNEFAKYVVDIQNTNFVNELLNELRGNVNNINFKTIQKIMTIFIGIVKYNNLSTIAITKGCKFLYDLMVECDIPSEISMKEKKVTSPINIFNFLISNYIKKINEEVNEDNKEKHEFVFKSKQLIKTEGENVVVEELGSEKEMKINYSSNKNYKRKVLNKNNSSGYEVLSISEDAGASKFIFKKIRDFNDFKQILKLFKFYNKHQIIEVLQKYEIDFIVNFVELIYFRDFMEMKELHRVVSIVLDFVKIKSLEYKPTTNKEKIVIDHSFVKDFDFTFYDDCIMMMEVLDFDPKRHFTKIYTYNELREYHDNLVKYFNVVSDKEKSAKFKGFVDRFKFLESKEDYKGPLEIKLIDSPSMLIKEGVVMKHSASSYSKKVINNIYLIGQVFDRSEGLDENELKRFTIGFTFHHLNGLEFDQVKGYANKQGSDRFKRLLMEYLETKDVSYKPLKDLKISQ